MTKAKYPPRPVITPETKMEIGRKYWLGKSLGAGALKVEYDISHGLLLKFAAAYRKAHPKVAA